MAAVGLAVWLGAGAVPVAASSPNASFHESNTSTIDVDYGGICVGSSTATYDATVHEQGDFVSGKYLLHVTEVATDVFTSTVTGQTYTGNARVELTVTVNPGQTHENSNTDVKYRLTAPDGSALTFGVLVVWTATDTSFDLHRFVQSCSVG
jgi:hypothetical protein